MPIVSAGICDKRGNLILSRQYDQLSRSAVLDLYASYPKLIKKDQQHTFIEDGRHRFLFVPNNDLLITIVTTLDFNIIQAQQTLKLFYRVVISLISQGINEKTVGEHSFDIVLALDDIISIGQRQSVTVEQVLDAVNMNSMNQQAWKADMQKKMQQARQQFQKNSKTK